MLSSLTDRDKVFRYQTFLTIACVIGMAANAIYSNYSIRTALEEKSQTVYAVVGESALRLRAMNVRENRPVEARSHVELFHRCLFDLDPDPETIDRQLDRALVLGDQSVRELYDRYREASYYSRLISDNVSQDVRPDSVTVDMSVHPYRFRYTGTQEITRATSVTTRSLVAEGYFRDVQRSDENPHGFLVEDYRIVENEDIRTVRRRKRT